MRRMLSNVGDGSGFVGLVQIRLLEDGQTVGELILDVAKEFTPQTPRELFPSCGAVDESFRDDVTNITSLDPGQRITARKAPEHP